mgnify:CR=1 FL=1
MQERVMFGPHNMTKAEAVAIVCNILIEELMIRATRLNEVRNYYDIGIVRYSGEGVEDVLPMSQNGLTPIVTLAKLRPEPQPIYIDQFDDKGYCKTVKFLLPQWVTPLAIGTTPLHEALCHIYSIANSWCTKPENRDSFPPIIINITDGEGSDGRTYDYLKIADNIKALKTDDGNVLFINIHLSKGTECSSIIYPSNDGFRSDDKSQQLLFEMSSVLPFCFEPLVYELTEHRYAGPYRGVAFNANVTELLSIISIGTESHKF